MTDSECNELSTIVQQSVDKLGEHFDSVRIFVTKYHGSGQTYNKIASSWNYFAQLGQVKLWLEREYELERIELTKDVDD